MLVKNVSETRDLDKLCILMQNFIKIRCEISKLSRFEAIQTALKGATCFEYLIRLYDIIRL